MSSSWTRIWAMSKKELRDYRRNRFVVVTMAVMPLVFTVAPMIQLFAIKVNAASSTFNARIGLALLYMLIIPAIVPSSLSAYSVVGEREQGTLEPVLITPIGSQEFLFGKALAAFLPTVAISYAVFGIFLTAARIFAQPIVASAIYSGSHIWVQLVFTPLLAGWSILVGIAISTRSADVRTAQQLSVLANLPPLVVVGLITFNVFHASAGITVAMAVALLVIDRFGWRAVAAMFDRERLVTGGRS